ncbi:glycosyltransferase family 2 protein [Deinococcus psychrotolerans]|uniref:Glycosyltransferase family 2 protein n=2 Tax=Deinococcus TaxID=1298 RepID=A0A553V4C2_9DEIO|nr:glycosyltransferase family 2 protein [Deinococcus psychrotolerans]TSA87343.1 glycosyltransferase family 2 protein [Deinococcus detaillensis]
MYHDRVPSVAVVIPAFNEAETVTDVIQAALSLTGDVVVASDGSTDNTAEVARAAGAQVVELPHNAGKGPALKAALQATTADYVVMLDADLVGLKREHLDILLSPVLSGKLGMSIGIFDGGGLITDLGNKLTPHLSGQRACARAWLLSVPHLGAERWPEPAITAALKEQHIKWDYVELPNLKQVMKEKKRGFWKGARYRTKMYIDLFGFKRRKKKAEKGG